jgi:BNR repeat-like domain
VAKLLAVGRARQKRLFRITSDDGGKPGSVMTLTSLPNPNFGVDATMLSEGRQLVIYNHTDRGRSPLNFAVSKGGNDGPVALVLEDEPPAEFSYPNVIQTRDGHVVLDPMRLTPRDMIDGQWPK